MTLRAAALAILALSTLNAQPPLKQTPADLVSLRYIDIQAGTGAPAAAGKRYTVHYTVWLTNGVKFDSSVDRNEPFHFVQGRRQVIAGWDLGFEGMKVGGKRRLFLPYQLAYGEKGTEGIPPKAELIFDVELLDVADAPDVAPAIDVLIPFAELEAKTLALVKSIPEDKFDRAFAVAFSRIANLNESLLEAATKDSPALASLSSERDLTSKNEVLSILTSSFEAVRKELETARSGYLGADASLLGKADTRRGLFTALDAAVAEQLGRAIAHAESLGISGRGIFETE